MAKLLKLRRGSTSDHSSFTGAEGECTVDTTKDTLVVHDGSTAGGHPVAAEDMANVSSSDIVGRLAAGSIVHAKLANDAVDGDNLADNACNSEHYTDGSIDHVHLAADAVDGDNIADNSINSEHYVDGSIDTDHIADDQVTLAKMAGLARGKIIVGDSSGNPSALAAGSNDQVLTMDANGDVGWEAAAGGTPTNITVADESSDTTCFPLFVTAASGDLPPKTGDNLTFNSANGALAATSFSGDGSALTGVAAASAGGSVYECAQTISSNYTMSSNKNGVSAGPITVSATVTIPSGSSWSIV